MMRGFETWVARVLLLNSGLTLAVSFGLLGAAQIVLVAEAALAGGALDRHARPLEQAAGGLHAQPQQQLRRRQIRLPPQPAVQGAHRQRARRRHPLDIDVLLQARAQPRRQAPVHILRIGLGHEL